ncbi:hypothetical protein [uncultured Kordia sp.]|uniref:hypothetical protein n=1 Tax=uncultured Kordia sp. TaxID=507699 RepID=UPI00261E85AC|nr:hypothetical protein [uncultured Kordia sp.]
MKKKIGNKLTFKKNVVSNLESVHGGALPNNGGHEPVKPADAPAWLSLPKTQCAECWPSSADPFWSNVGCYR